MYKYCVFAKSNWDWTQVQKLRSPSPYMYTSNLYIEIYIVSKALIYPFPLLHESKLICYCNFCSSISTWVKNCEKLDLAEEKKEEVDLFIDKLYEELEKGK